jgi:hypothetical protein
MDIAGASRTLHALRRLLGLAAAVLLALALAAGSARAQVATPPGTATNPTAPGGGYDEDDPWADPGYVVPAWPDGATAPQPGPAPGLWPDAGDGGYEQPVEPELPPITSSYVAGKEARMRTDGRAAIPRGAPKRVRSLISQYNRIVGKRYKWGGGHATLVDTGYDCSGAVGYGLIKGGLLRTTMVSGQFARWGAAGAGRWITIYAHKDHVYMEIAGLRLDTSPVGDRSGRSGVRWRPLIGKRDGFKVRHPVGL